MMPKVKTIAAQPSWLLRSKDVSLAVTQRGGHMAPVTFYLRDAAHVQPYHISPWQEEKPRLDEPMLVPLRGDYFCMPFGARCKFAGKTFAAHGQTAGNVWDLVGASQFGQAVSLTLSMRTTVPKGRVTKTLALVDGHNVVYCRHVLEGFSGRFTIGHHPNLAMPLTQQSVHVATSAILFGMTNPVPPGDPAEGSYYSLAVNECFSDLRSVPSIWAEPRQVDCSRFPARKGFCDILAVFNDPQVSPAWTAATFEEGGFIWFSLKDPALLPATLLWSENHGRHMAPWSGRNSCLGLEDVCAFMAEGQAQSVRPNELSAAGVPTCLKFSPKTPIVINYIQGVVKAPRSFGRVKDLVREPGRIRLISEAGKSVTAPVYHEFIRDGKLPAQSEA